MTSPREAIRATPPSAVISASGTYQPLVTKIIRLHLQRGSQCCLWSGNRSPELFHCVSTARVNTGIPGSWKREGVREAVHGWHLIHLGARSLLFAYLYAGQSWYVCRGLWLLTELRMETGNFLQGRDWNCRCSQSYCHLWWDTTLPLLLSCFPVCNKQSKGWSHHPEVHSICKSIGKDILYWKRGKVDADNCPIFSATQRVNASLDDLQSHQDDTLKMKSLCWSPKR